MGCVGNVFWIITFTLLVVTMNLIDWFVYFKGFNSVPQWSVYIHDHLSAFKQIIEILRCGVFYESVLGMSSLTIYIYLYVMISSILKTKMFAY